MKLLMLVTMVCQAFALASQAVSQTPKIQPERLHFAASFPEGHKVLFQFAASDAKRILSPTEGESASVLQLRGEVEVRLTTCPPTRGGCVTSPMVLHADAVDYNEKTGEIDARGNVHTSYIDASPRQPRPQGYAPEPLQRPLLTRAASTASE